MAWTGTTAPLLHLLIFIKRLNETFCNFMHMTAILLHHELFLFSHLECIQDFPKALERDKSLLIRLTHNINLFLISDVTSINQFSRAHVTY